MEAVHLIHDAGEDGAAPAVVLYGGEDALEALGHGAGAEIAELGPELVVDEGQHLVRLVGHLRPNGPAVFAGKEGFALRVRGAFALEDGNGVLRVLGFVVCLEEEHPRELLDVVARLDAVGVQVVAGRLDGDIDLGAAVFKRGGFRRSSGCGRFRGAGFLGVSGGHERDI